MGARRADPLGSRRRRGALARSMSAGDEDELRGTIAATRNRLPERPFLLLGQQSLADPSRSPDGKHTAWAYTHGPRSGVDWPRELERHIARVEAQVERFAPGFRELILARHVMPPATLERRDRNLVGGDVGGGSYQLRQVTFRPLPGLSPDPDPARWPLPGERRDLPRRSRARGAGRRRRARRSHPRLTQRWDDEAASDQCALGGLIVSGSAGQRRALVVLAVVPSPWGRPCSAVRRAEPAAHGFDRVEHRLGDRGAWTQAAA